MKFCKQTYKRTSKALKKLILKGTTKIGLLQSFLDKHKRFNQRKISRIISSVSIKLNRNNTT